MTEAHIVQALQLVPCLGNYPLRVECSNCADAAVCRTVIAKERVLAKVKELEKTLRGELQ